MLKQTRSIRFARTHYGNHCSILNSVNKIIWNKCKLRKHRKLCFVQLSNASLDFEWSKRGRKHVWKTHRRRRYCMCVPWARAFRPSISITLHSFRTNLKEGCIFHPHFKLIERIAVRSLDSQSVKLVEKYLRAKTRCNIKTVRSYVRFRVQNLMR